MKKYILIFTLALAGLMMSCGDDFLNRFPYTSVTAEQPMTLRIIDHLVVGTYQVLGFDCFAAGQWMPVTMFTDILADNALPGGGDANDQPQLQQAAIFNSNPATSRADGWWQIYYSGIQRANTALVAIENATEETVLRHGELLAQRRAELLTLRAWYTKWIWKAHGNIPIPFFDRTGTLDNTPASQWVTPTSVPQQTIYSALAFMLQDLDEVIALPATVFPDVRPRSGPDRGRVHRAMAKMARARIVLHAKGMIDANVRDIDGNLAPADVIADINRRLPIILQDMQWVINQPLFGLVTTGGYAFLGRPNNVAANAVTAYVENPFQWIFLGAMPANASNPTGGGEFSSESVFETVSNTNAGTGWGSAWTGSGNYTPRFIAIRQDPAPANQLFFPTGWGFATVRPDAYAIFSERDRRREVSVMNWAQHFYDAGARYNWGMGFQNTGLWMGKQIARFGDNQGQGGDRDLNFNVNRRLFRIAEAYLNIAELQVIHGVTAPGVMSAQAALDAIRDRAYGTTTDRIPATESNIKLEWRREFFGEGLRWWQLLRWGRDEQGRPLSVVLAGTTFTTPLNTVGEQATVVQTRTWDERSRFLPIPQNNIEATVGLTYELRQNPGYL